MRGLKKLILKRKNKIMRDNEKNKTIVYWAPAYITTGEDPQDWNMLYKEPVNLIKELKKDRNLEAKADNYLLCPAFSNIHKNTYVFKNSIEGDFFKNELGIWLSKNENYISASEVREPTLNRSSLLTYNLQWIFFSEDPDLEMSVTPAYFHKTSYSGEGAFMPGRFNIGSWFREINADIQLWKDVDSIKINKNDPLYYANFNTDKEVVLKRFNMTSEMQTISKACRNYKMTFGEFSTLLQRYNDFKSSKTHKLILSMIEKNVL